MTEKRPRADSAGVPWEGRRFPPSASTADDGSADPRLIAAIAAFRDGQEGQGSVVAAIRGARLLVPLVAGAARIGDGARDHAVDTRAELSIVTVAGPDGRNVMPAFTSTTAMSRWNPSARPVPVSAERVALAAASENTELVVLDATSPTEFALRRPALWAVAQGLPWVPADADHEVSDALRESVAGEPAVTGLTVVSGDPQSRLVAPELLITLALRPGLDSSAIAALVQRLRTRWADAAIIAERVDSLALKLVPAR